MGINTRKMENKKRIAIFAHYDKGNIIDDYVIYYLNELKKVVQKIIFVSDCNLEINEASKIVNIADEIIAKPHGEYDFGSYKRGFLFALENNMLDDADECIFANDSCYGPFHPLTEIFTKTDEQVCDFWGILENKFGLIYKNGECLNKKRPHLQSYFLVFRKKVFLSDIFINFMKAIKKEENKFDVIINYEIGLNEKLIQAGFKAEKFIEPKLKSRNFTIYKWKKLILKYNMPFLKCSLAKLENMQYTVANDYHKVINKVSDYPVELIYKNVVRTSSNKDFLSFIPAILRPFAYKTFYYAKKRLKKLSFKKSVNPDKK